MINKKKQDLLLVNKNKYIHSQLFAGLFAIESINSSNSKILLPGIHIVYIKICQIEHLILKFQKGNSIFYFYNDA